MEVLQSCFDVSLLFIYLCLLVDRFGAMEVLRFRYNGYAGNDCFYY